VVFSDARSMGSPPRERGTGDGVMESASRYGTEGIKCGLSLTGRCVFSYKTRRTEGRAVWRLQVYFPNDFVQGPPMIRFKVHACWTSGMPTGGDQIVNISVREYGPLWLGLLPVEEQRVSSFDCTGRCRAPPRASITNWSCTDFTRMSIKRFRYLFGYFGSYLQN
jgi:hypothetical protein